MEEVFSRDAVALTEAGHIDFSRMTPFCVYVFLGQVNLSNSTGGAVSYGQKPPCCRIGRQRW